jgi:adenylate cyclase
MPQERVQRRLAAILAADVVGYSRLMGKDEAGTRARFNALLTELIEPAIASCRGRIVKTTGDALLVEFASAVDAVQCAVEIQSDIAERNVDEPEDRRIVFRIGVNLGDVIIEGNDIHGDGVNVAARLEGLADPGGVLISDKVHTEIRTKLNVEFDDLGPQAVKNIAEPISVWRARLGSESMAGGLNVNMAMAAPDFGGRPTIAVLPFDSVSGDSEWLADGLTDAVITALSRFSWFIVIDRNTSYAYKHKKIGIAELKKDFGIAYVLEGNLRTAGQRIRVSAQLLDAKSGGNIWADQFDSQTDDPFEMEDKITRSILAELTPRLLSAEARRAQFTSSGGSWDLIMQGRGLLWHVNEDDVARAQILFHKAIDMDQDSGLGECDLAWTYIYQRIYG